MFRSSITAMSLVLLAAVQAPAEPGTPVASVRGTAISGAFGVPSAEYHDQIKINAWLESDGTVRGSVTWTAIYNSLYPGYHGHGYSGYPWQLEVTGLWIQGTDALIQAVVVNSPQISSDEGTVFYFLVEDHGDGNHADGLFVVSEYYYPDFFDLGLTFGNFTVESID